MPDLLVTTYLEMTSPADFRPAYLEDTQDLEIIRMGLPDVGFYRFLYGSVGETWRWRDRLSNSETELLAVLSHPGTSVDVLYFKGAPAGYLELVPQGESTEIAYFGLRPAYIGKGFGKHLLSYGIAQAWKSGTKRLWVHTCNLDSPYALDNYQKRGFKVYKIEEQLMPQQYS